MKKLLLAAAILTAGAASAQETALAPQKWADNWYLGLDGGVTTPLKHAAFFGDMRGMFGLHLQKQLTPTFGIGAEALAAVNTSSWDGNGYWMTEAAGPVWNDGRSHTGIDQSYVGVYGTVNLCTLFGGYQMYSKPVGLDLQFGAGWGHEFRNTKPGVAMTNDENYFATKVGLDLHFRLCDRLTFSVKPSVTYNMTGKRTFPLDVEYTSAAYERTRAQFNLLAGLTLRVGNDFEFVRPYDAAEVAELNGRVNDLRSQLDACNAQGAALTAEGARLEKELTACKNKKPEVITETTNSLQSVRYVNFLIGKTNITPSQMPNVEAVADYLKNHPNSTVMIKGYASQDGPVEINERLARERAESVKNTLIKKYGIKADRIKAEGEGIGHMFSEESWNRVAICTVD